MKVKFENGVIGTIAETVEHYDDLKEFLTEKTENGEKVHGCADVDGKPYANYIVEVF